MTKDELYERGALVQRYLAGEMTPDEEVAFERQVVSDPALAADLDTANQALTGIFDAMASGAPAPRKQLKNILLEKASGVVKQREQYRVNEFHLTGEEAEWIRTIIPGVEIQIMYVDDDGRAMMKARFAPGATFPPHIRTGIEECLVLSGDFWADNVHMHAGDFVAGRPGEEPLPLHSENGCELLLKIPVPYEIMPKQ
jgi:anti-sigma factor ChrR (cupin superfamily)